MENDPTNNPQFKRKQTSSLTSGIKSKKKITVIPIKLNSYNESLKIPTVSTTTDSNIALDVTTKATEYVCELAEGLADEYYTEDLIRPSLAKIAKALDQVVDTRHPRRLTFGTQDSEPYQIHQTHNQKLHSTKEQPSHAVPVKPTIRYLGVNLDTRLSFTTHIATVSRKAADSAMTVGRLMPNAVGPTQAKSALMGSVTNSKLLYASPIWATTSIKTAKNRNAMARAPRTTNLRTKKAYRTRDSEESA
ncbi:hypothetical protein QTP88_015390 [Uroleucon formosanum]